MLLISKHLRTFSTSVAPNLPTAVTLVRGEKIVREAAPDLPSLLGTHYSKVYFIKNFPPINAPVSTESLLKETFFMRKDHYQKI